MIPQSGLSVPAAVERLKQLPKDQMPDCWERISKIEAHPNKLNQWLGRVSHEPVQIATETPDLSAELKRGLAYVRSSRKRRNK